MLANWLYTVKTKCIYHINGVLYGTVGVLINLIKVRLVFCGVKYQTAFLTKHACISH